jgi:hypothetical protein
MDAACAWQNMFRSEQRTLTMESIHMMVAKETGLHPGALSDEKYVKGETFDPTKMKVSVGAKNFADTESVKIAPEVSPSAE